MANSRLVKIPGSGPDLGLDGMEEYIMGALDSLTVLLDAEMISQVSTNQYLVEFKDAEELMVSCIKLSDDDLSRMVASTLLKASKKCCSAIMDKQVEKLRTELDSSFWKRYRSK